MRALELQPGQALAPPPGSWRCPRAPSHSEILGAGAGSVSSHFIATSVSILSFVLYNISELVISLMFSVGHRMHANELIILHRAGCSMRRRSIDIKRSSLSILEVNPRDQGRTTPWVKGWGLPL